MKTITPRLGLLLPLFVPLASAVEIVYVTDLEIYTLLAGCAQTAISYVVQSQTYANCPEAVTDLQSCVCTKNNNLPSISTQLSSSVSYECGSTASEDQASAFSVLNLYCNQGADIHFATPTTNIVQQYVTDIPAYSNLAPCAQYGVSSAVMSMTYDLCPEPASLLAPCVCGKNQNSLRASQSINSIVKSTCSNNDDITSAQAFFSAYCAMVTGSTAFPQPSDPPGDMTYYITALPQYGSLAGCAQSGLSYALSSQQSSLCPQGPKAMASCACLKGGMSSMASSMINSNVKYYCSSTATEDITSALNVFAFYCSAARNEVVASVTESITQNYATGSPATKGTTNKTGAPTSGSNPENSSGPNIGVVIGGVVGGVAILGLAGLATFCIFKRKRAAANANTNAFAGANGSMTNLQPINDKPELAGSPINGPLPPPSPHPSIIKSHSPGPGNDIVSPASPYSATGGVTGTPSPISAHPYANVNELHGNPSPYGPQFVELPAQPYSYPAAELPAYAGPNPGQAYGNPGYGYAQGHPQGQQQGQAGYYVPQGQQHGSDMGWRGQQYQELEGEVRR